MFSPCLLFRSPSTLFALNITSHCEQDMAETAEGTRIWSKEIFEENITFVMTEVSTTLAMPKFLHILCSQHHLALQTGCGGGVELKEKSVTIIKLG